MSRLVRQTLRQAQATLRRAARGIDRWLIGAPVPHEPYVKDLTEAYARGFANCPCVFVLSTGRVGTKSLAALVALSPNVVANHEPAPRLVKLPFDAYLETGGAMGDSDKWRTVVLGARDDWVVDANRRGKVYFETNPRLTYLARALATAFPASRFIHLHRHPYEVVRSQMRRGHYQGHHWDFVRMHPRPGELWEKEWQDFSPLERNAWYWARLNGDALAFLASLPQSRRLDLPAEDLFAGDAATLERIFACAGVALPRRELLEDVLGQKINSQRRGAYPPPSEWSEADREAVARQVHEVAAALGYGDVEAPRGPADELQTGASPETDGAERSSGVAEPGRAPARASARSV